MCVCRLRLRCLHTSSRSFYDTGMFTFLYSFRCICLPLGEIKLINSSDALRRRIRTTGLFTAEVNEFTYFVDSVTVNNQVLRVRSSSTSSGPSYFAHEMGIPKSDDSSFIDWSSDAKICCFHTEDNIYRMHRHHSCSDVIAEKGTMFFTSVCLSVCLLIGLLKITDQRSDLYEIF